MKQTVIGFIFGIATCISVWAFTHTPVAADSQRGDTSSGIAVGASCQGDLNGDGVVNVSDLLILLGNWGTCPSEPNPNSCKGNCGGASSDGTCFCDEDCVMFGDCCEDYNDFCVDKPAPNSCEGACGGASSDGTCFCDEDCVMFGDCCEDYNDFCVDKPAPNSCEGACGGASSDGTCYCDEDCVMFGDCCEDVCDHCDWSNC